MPGFKLQSGLVSNRFGCTTAGTRARAEARADARADARDDFRCAHRVQRTAQSAERRASHTKEPWWYLQLDHGVANVVAVVDVDVSVGEGERAGYVAGDLGIGNIIRVFKN